MALHEARQLEHGPGVMGFGLSGRPSMTVWLSRLHVRFIIEISSRRIHLAGVTTPPRDWVLQGPATWPGIPDGHLQARFLARDRDSKVAASIQSS